MNPWDSIASLIEISWEIYGPTLYLPNLCKSLLQESKTFDIKTLFMQEEKKNPQFAYVCRPLFSECENALLVVHWLYQIRKYIMSLQSQPQYVITTPQS